jgi:hypothetical protein
MAEHNAATIIVFAVALIVRKMCRKLLISRVWSRDFIVAIVVPLSSLGSMQPLQTRTPVLP